MTDVHACATPPDGRSLYVYYRVRAGQEAQARMAIETMQATLRPLQPGLRAQLMRRADDAGNAGSAGDATWMEVYEHPDGVSPACEAMLKSLGEALPGGLFAGPRHIEIFAAL